FRQASMCEKREQARLACYRQIVSVRGHLDRIDKLASQTICGAENLHGPHEIKLLDGWNNDHRNAPPLEKTLARAITLWDLRHNFVQYALQTAYSTSGKRGFGTKRRVLVRIVLLQLATIELLCPLEGHAEGV